MLQTVPETDNTIHIYTVCYLEQFVFLALQTVPPNKPTLFLMENL